MGKCGKCGSPACMCGSPAHMRPDQQTLQEQAGLQGEVIHQGSYDLPPMASKKSSFNPYTESVANGLYGNTMQRQMSMPNPPLFKLDPMYNGEPGVQKEDFEQFKK